MKWISTYLLYRQRRKSAVSIPDNGLLCLFYGNGDRHFAVCHRLMTPMQKLTG